MSLINYPILKRYAGSFTRIVLLSLSLTCFFSIKAVSQNIVEKAFFPFKQLGKLPVAQRVLKASDLYKATCRHLPEHAAMSVLDSVELFAQKLDDRSLECSVYILRADYYSVNQGYNNTSINYHQKAIDFATAHEMPVETAVATHKKGQYFFTFNHTIEACKYFLQAYDMFKQIGFDNVPDISRYMAEQAQFYYTLADYQTAKPLLQIALKHPISQVRIRINLTTTMGLIYRNNRQYTQAINYFNKALDIAKANKDTAWIAISTGNIGSIYFLKGDYQKAIPDLTVDYRACIKYQQYTNAANSLLRLSRINIYYGQLTSAKARVDSAEAMIKGSKEDVLAIMTEIYSQRSILAQKAGNYQDVLLYNKKHQSNRDSIDKRDNIGELERVKLRFETEKYRIQLEQLKTSADIDAFKRNAIIFILFLLIIIFILLFNRFRLNAKRDQELLLVRKRRVDEKLRDSAESLKQYTENIQQSNALIEKFKTELDRVKERSTDRAGAEHLEKLMEAHIMTDDSWNEFKKLFSKVHGGFFSKLRNNFPYLTDTDTRLLSLIKLGLNNREMANMLGITVEGVKKSKQRLRKKMQLSSETDIEHTVAGL